MVEPAILDALWITFQAAFGAVLLAGAPGVLVGWTLARRDFRGKALVETFCALPLVLPATAIGYLLLSLFARDGLFGERRLGFDPGVLFTLRGAILASAVMSFPLIARTAREAFERVDPRLELMARSLGMGPLAAFARVSLPLAGRGLAGALVLGFGRALGEFGATVIVAGNIPGRTQTLALAIFEDIQLDDRERALKLVGLTCVLAFAVLAASERFLARDRAGSAART